MKETAIKNQVLKMIRKEFYPLVYVRKIKDDTHSGYLDLFLCVMGKFAAIELKTKIGRTTPLQDNEIKEIMAAGGLVAVCRSVDEARSFIGKVISGTA